MSYFYRVFTARVLKTLLLVCLVGLLITAIWYLGPFFGFGETRPLQRIESRLIFILLSLFCLVSFWLGWPLFILIAATACVFVWVLGPFLLTGHQHPLAPYGIRLVVIAAIMLAALLYGIWQLLLAMKDNPALLDKFTRRRPTVSENDVSEVNSAIRSAVEYVNRNRSSLSFFQRVILARTPLDTLPWYMVLGSESAGKTSAVLASGQHFPLPEQLNQTGKPGQPTHSCECWFANDAIYLDTAGKYISEPQASQPEWQALLKALKKYRPVRALNGAIMTLSAAQVLGSDEEERFELAATLRAKLVDLRQTLGVRFPVYIVVTKLDQLCGFSEYFRMLTEQEREQVWGVTFPWGTTEKNSVAGLDEQIMAEFSLLEKRIKRETIVRLQEEYDTSDRKKLYALPQDFQLLTVGLTQMLQNIFFASRYDDTHSHTLLRGVYFTSSHQPVDDRLLNNRTLIRKWSNHVNHHPTTLSASVVPQVNEGPSLIKDISYGRQYFLKQLFNEVVVKDAGLAQHNIAGESKYRFQRLLGHCLCVLTVLLLLNGFHQSYRYNSTYLHAVEEKAERLNQKVGNYARTADNNLLPGMLMLSQYLPEFGALDIYNPPLRWRYGLYTGNDMVNAAGNTYQYFLQHLLLSQIERQVTLSLQQAIDGEKADEIYAQLKLYLMVFGLGKTDQHYMIDEIARLWEITGKIQPYQERSIFIAHLTDLLASRSWRQYGHPADDLLVKSARAALNQENVAERLYQRIKTSLVPDTPADLTLGAMINSHNSSISPLAGMINSQSSGIVSLADMINSQSSGIFSLADDSQARAIPGLFTRAGYHDLFKKKLMLSLPGLEREDAWIMGNTLTLPVVRIAENVTLVDPVKQQILERYLNEYTQHWQRFLANIHLDSGIFTPDYGDAGMTADIYMLRMLAASDSPLIKLARRAVDETTLSEKEIDLPTGTITQGRILNKATKVSLAYAALEKKLLWQYVDGHFAPLREFVTGNAQTLGGERSAQVNTGLNKLMGLLNQQYTLLVVYDDALKKGTPPALSNSALTLSAESHTWPDPLQEVVGPLLEGAYQRAAKQAITKSIEGVDESIGQVCRATLARRYPFADSPREVKIADFERFFAADGLADRYFEKNLADRIDTTTHPWHYRGSTDIDDRGVLEMFERAAEIRDAFFQDPGSRKLSIAYSVAVPFLDSNITQLNMNFDGTQVNYVHGPVSPFALNWPGLSKGSRITLNATPRTALGHSGMIFTGPWALFRWLENAHQVSTSGSGDTVLVYSLGKRRAEIEVAGMSFDGRLTTEMLKTFRCPDVD